MKPSVDCWRRAAPRRRYDATRQTGLLTFARSGDRLTGMPVLALLYPCGRAGDGRRSALRRRGCSTSRCRSVGRR